MTFERSNPTEGRRCPMCPAGTLEQGTTTVTNEREGAMIVFKAVPADVCDACGEAFLGEDVSEHVSQEAEAAVAAGVELEVRRFYARARATG